MSEAEQRKIRIKIFGSLCWHDCDFMSCWIPLPTTVISQMLGISLYQCRKQMKKLVQEGLAESCSAILDKEESLLPYRGFRLTPKGKKHDIHKYCELKHARICSECFGGTIDSWIIDKNIRKWI